MVGNASALWLESLEEHLPMSIAGVLRLRAMSRPLCDKFARRFAQDDGFVGGEKLTVSCAKRMTVLWEFWKTER